MKTNTLRLNFREGVNSPLHNHMEIYHKQNRIQREITKFLSNFRKDPDKIRHLEGRGIRVYNPKVKKWRVGIASSIFFILLITPFTPEFLFLPKLIMWVLR